MVFDAQCARHAAAKVKLIIIIHCDRMNTAARRRSSTAKQVFFFFFLNESKTSSKPKRKINENEMKTILDETSSAGCTNNNTPVPHHHFHSGQKERERKLYISFMPTFRTITARWECGEKKPKKNTKNWEKNNHFETMMKMINKLLSKWHQFTFHGLIFIEYHENRIKWPTAPQA